MSAPNTRQINQLKLQIKQCQDEIARLQRVLDKKQEALADLEKTPESAIATGDASSQEASPIIPAASS